MRLKTQDYNDITIVELQGELDGDLTETLQNATTDIAQKHKIGIVLDLSAVVFIDSQGLELLLWVRDYCHQNKIQLRLAGLDENCKKILEVTRLEGAFDRYAELTEAVKSFV